MVELNFGKDWLSGKNIPETLYYGYYSIDSNPSYCPSRVGILADDQDTQLETVDTLAFYQLLKTYHDRASHERHSPETLAMYEDLEMKASTEGISDPAYSPFISLFTTGDKAALRAERPEAVTSEDLRICEISGRALRSCGSKVLKFGDVFDIGEYENTHGEYIVWKGISSVAVSNCQIYRVANDGGQGVDAGNTNQEASKSDRSADQEKGNCCAGNSKGEVFQRLGLLWGEE